MSTPTINDAHSHFLYDEPSINSLPDLKHKIICMSCEPSEWEIVSDLATKYPTLIIPAFGIHPWKAHLYDSQIVTPDSPLLSHLQTLIAKHPNAVIGEIGLDFFATRIAPTETHSTEAIKQAQLQVFQSFVTFAQLNYLPISIHCVKAFEEIKQILLSKAKDCNSKIMFHSYGGNLTMTRHLLPILEVYFSFSHLLNASKWRDRVVQQIPRTRILVESDFHSLEGAQEALQQMCRLVETVHEGFNAEEANKNFERFLVPKKRPQ